MLPVLPGHRVMIEMAMLVNLVPLSEAIVLEHISIRLNLYGFPFRGFRDSFSVSIEGSFGMTRAYSTELLAIFWTDFGVT